MSSNPIQFQQGMSLPEFLQCFGTEAACIAALRRALTRGLPVPTVLVRCALRAGSRAAALVSMQRLPSPNLAVRGNAVLEHQAAVEPVVPGHLPAQSGQDRAGGAAESPC
jgi:hypothetical protein